MSSECRGRIQTHLGKLMEPDRVRTLARGIVGSGHVAPVTRNTAQKQCYDSTRTVRRWECLDFSAMIPFTGLAEGLL